MMKFFGAVLFAMLALVTYADSPEDKGLAIAREAATRDDGWGDMKAIVVMVLRNASGQKSMRRIEMRSLEVEADGDKSLTIFRQPADIKGTAFLSHTHPKN